MNIIIEGNPYLRKLAINILTNYQTNRSNKYIKYSKKKTNISKSMLIDEVNQLINNPIVTPLYLVCESTGERIELNNTIDINSLQNLNDNFYSIFYEEMESKVVYTVDESLLSTTDENECKIIERTYKNLTPSEYKKYFSSLYDLIAKQVKSTDKIERPDVVNIKHFIIDKSPFSLYSDDINFEKFTLEQLQNFKNLEDLFEKPVNEIKIIVNQEKKDENIIYETDIKEKDIVTNYGLSRSWVNDLLYLRNDQNNIISQIDYKHSNLTTSDLQEIATSIIDNDIVFINLTNISEEGYNRYVSVENVPFTEDEQRKILSSRIDTSLLLSEINSSDTLHNSIDIKSFFKYKKPTIKKKKTTDEDFKIQVDIDTYSEKFNSDKIYKKYYEINIPFSQRNNVSEDSPSSKVIRLDSIKETLYKRLKEIIDLQK